MFIKAMTVEGVEGDVEMARTEDGILVTIDNRIVCHMRTNESRESRFEKACEAAKFICGTDRKGRPNATNSMIHDVFNEMSRIAGC